MGKIADALEKRKKETSIKTEPVLPPVREETASPPEPVITKLEDRAGGLEYNPKLVVLTAPESIDAENFKVLRSQILFGKDEERPKTIMISSAFPGEGKSFVAANLALSISQGIDEYVLLIDCDLRRPNIHNLFGYTRSEGLHEYLIAKKTLPELIIRTKHKKLSLLLAGKPSKQPTELLASKMMGKFIDEVKGRYDDRFVIIDSTPSQITAEANVLAKHVDGVILVVMAGKSPKRAIEKSIENLGKEKILGIVFNGNNKAHKNYNKYYRRYYK